jgi:hypothetical protein
MKKAKLAIIETMSVNEANQLIGSDSGAGNLSDHPTGTSLGTEGGFGSTCASGQNSVNNLINSFNQGGYGWSKNSSGGVTGGPGVHAAIDCKQDRSSSEALTSAAGHSSSRRRRQARTSIVLF